MNEELILEKRLHNLRERHRSLDEQLNGAMHHEYTLDELGMVRLKKEKLHLRDQIAYLERMIYPDVPA